MSHADTPAMKKQNVKKELDRDCKGLCTPKCEKTTYTLPVAKSVMKQVVKQEVTESTTSKAPPKENARMQLKAKAKPRPRKTPTNPNTIASNRYADNADDASGSQCMQPEAFIVISQSVSHGVRCC